MHDCGYNEKQKLEDDVASGTANNRPGRLTANEIAEIKCLTDYLLEAKLATEDAKRREQEAVRKYNDYLWELEFRNRDHE